MQYANDIVQNGNAPANLNSWTSQGVTITSVEGINVFTLNSNAFMRQGGELQTIDISLNPKGIQLECTFDLTQLQEMEHLDINAYTRLELVYSEGGRDIFTQPLIESFTTVSGDWYTSIWNLFTRENSILVALYFEVYTGALSTPLYIKTIKVRPGLDDLMLHNADENPHQLPLAIKVGQFGIKATKGEKVMFWLKDTGDALFAGNIHITRDDGKAELILSPEETVFRAKDESGVMRDRIYFDLASGNYKFTGDLNITSSSGNSEVSFNDSEITFRGKDNQGTMKDRIYFDTATGKYVFDGDLSATTIEAVKAQIDVVVSETVIVNNLYAQTGRIADLTVNHLLTGDFLSGDNELFYIDIIEDKIEFIQAYKNNSPMIQYTSVHGELLYWESATHEFMTTEITDWPVMVYQYDSSIVFCIKIEDITDSVGQLRIPVMEFGRGDGETQLSAKGRIYKGRTSLITEYFKSNSGDRLAIELADDGIQFHGYPTIFTGTSEPAENLGKDGDIYVKF